MSTITSIRERRGRKQVLANGGFQPLSVFTKSLLLPFALDTDGALDVLKSDSPERIEEAKKVLSPDRAEIQELLEDTDEYLTPSPATSTPESFIRLESLEGAQSTTDSDMDLITALKTTSPENDTHSRIHTDFTTLCQLPVPEPSQHPVFSSNPFEAKTEPPLLLTSTSIDEIRLSNHKNLRQDSSSKISKDSIERKRSFFGLELKTPASNRSRNASRMSEESPLGMIFPTPHTSTTHSSIKSSSPLNVEFIVPRESASTNSTSSSVRKFSDLFRRKDNIERNPDPPSWSPRNSQESPNMDRQDLEKYLRRTSNAPTYDYDPYNPYPRHPNTGRGWKSRNLKCTTCSEACCAVCHRVCCAYRAAVLACETHQEGSSARTMASQRIQEITKLFPYGREAPTYLQCTAKVDGDMAGCGKLVCPDCCSICPDEMCADTLCRRCKPAMWEDCDWHKGDVLMLDSKGLSA